MCRICGHPLRYSDIYCLKIKVLGENKPFSCVWLTMCRLVFIHHLDSFVGRKVEKMQLYGGAEIK